MVGVRHHRSPAGWQMSTDIANGTVRMAPEMWIQDEADRLGFQVPLGSSTPLRSWEGTKLEHLGYA